LVPIPDPVSFAQAAALVHDGVTGGALVEGLGVRRGDRVLVVRPAVAWGSS
jgi:NADPH:quinone reductase-like Zn-dependent oxidoreductase